MTAHFNTTGSDIQKAAPAEVTIDARIKSINDYLVSCENSHNAMRDLLFSNADGSDREAPTPTCMQTWLLDIEQRLAVLSKSMGMTASSLGCK